MTLLFPIRNQLWSGHGSVGTSGMSETLGSVTNNSPQIFKIDPSLNHKTSEGSGAGEVGSSQEHWLLQQRACIPVPTLPQQLITPVPLLASMGAGHTWCTLMKTFAHTENKMNRF